jgi:hypothetical protein
MQCPSRISACRRELNSHDAAKPRENAHPLQRTGRQVPVECNRAEGPSVIPSRESTRRLPRIGAAQNYQDKVPQCHIESAHCVGSSGFHSVCRAAEISVGASALGQVARRLEFVACHGRQRGAGSTCGRPPGIKGLGRPTAATLRAQRCLTPRSSGAPTAGHQARAGGTLYIVACPGLVACRRLPLSSNVRRHQDHILFFTCEFAAAGRVKTGLVNASSCLLASPIPSARLPPLEPRVCPCSQAPKPSPRQASTPLGVRAPVVYRLAPSPLPTSALLSRGLQRDA